MNLINENMTLINFQQSTELYPLFSMHCLPSMCTATIAAANRATAVAAVLACQICLQ